MGRRSRPWWAAVLLLGVACSRRLPAGWAYVTRVTPTAATVVWTGPMETVDCRRPDGRSVQVVAPEGRRGLRVARLAGLVPATDYGCRIGPGHPPSRVRFRTASVESVPFTFAAVGDTGDGSRTAAALARRILAGRPAFLVHLGDFAYPGGKARQYAAEFFRPYGRLLRRIPLMPTPGNHDLEPRSVYHDLFAPAADGEDAGGPHYAFDWNAAHLVSVSSPEFARDGAPGAGWLAADLAAAAVRPWRIVFLHEPPYSAGVKFTVPGLRDVLEPIVERGRTDLVLAGHEHLYERSTPACAYAAEARTLHVVSGGGGANLDPDPVRPHPNFPRVVSVTHYLRIRVTPAELDIRAVDVSGHVVDRVRRRRGADVACLSSGWPPPRDR
ncbi:MAG: hypothetical protein E6J79_00955 [Deltaproteobacteria bacterium]|nr:MAG: hypothetical protein E6J79_00955 [Deltaproteobacteria bacterium]